VAVFVGFRSSTQPTMAALFAALANIVGWVKRDTSTIFVGFAYLNIPQQSEIIYKLANPTQLLQTIGLTQPTIYRFGLRSGYPLCFLYETFTNDLLGLALWKTYLI